jgi:hypothetical protein
MAGVSWQPVVLHNETGETGWPCPRFFTFRGHGIPYEANYSACLILRSPFILVRAGGPSPIR